VKDDVNQAYMQAFNKLSSGYKQAAGEADLAKLLMGDDLWVDDEDDDDNTKSPLAPIDQLMYLMDALQMASTSEPESYQHVQSALSVDTLALFQTLNCSRIKNATTTTTRMRQVIMS